jgi:hypothetical protein
VVSFISGGNRGSGENHRPAANHWQTLSHNVVHSAGFTYKLDRVSNFRGAPAKVYNIFNTVINGLSHLCCHNVYCTFEATIQ